MKIGVLSDTHGILFPEIVQRLRGVDHIIHAGDIGAGYVIQDLARLAPVSAVTGNHDWGTELDPQYPREQTLILADCRFYITHIGMLPALWYPQLPPPTPRVVICGHTHRPAIHHHEGVLFLNPGSAALPRRAFFQRDTRLNCALITIEAGQPSAEVLFV